MVKRSAWFERARGLIPAQWRRDARMVLDGLAGHPPPPFSSRGSSDRAASSPSTSSLPGARPLRVAAVTRETPDAVSLTLVDPRGGAIAYRPGQFFTLAIRMEAEVLRRAYSPSLPMEEASPPGSVRLTIKRVAGGRVSGHLLEHAAAGEVMDVFGPSGSFVLEGAPRTLVLLGGLRGDAPRGHRARRALPPPGHPRGLHCRQSFH